MKSPLSYGVKLFEQNKNIHLHLHYQTCQFPIQGGPWKHVCSFILRNQEASKIALKGVRKNVKNGKASLFWHDTWLGETALKMIFPRLFAIAILPNGLVASHGFWEGLVWIWSFAWRRDLRPQDLTEKAHLAVMLQQAHIAYEGRDKLIWAFNSAGSFSSKSFALELDRIRSTPQREVIKGMWKGLVPHRIGIFVWTTLLEKINTKNKLASLGIIPNDEDTCILCSLYHESSNHLLLHCQFAQKIRNWWLSLWNVKWVFPRTLKEAFSQWQTRSKYVFFKKAWHATFFIIVWSIWKERNSRIFEKSCSSTKNIQDLVLLRLGWWIKGWCDDFPYSPLDIQRDPSCLLWNGFADVLSSLKPKPPPHSVESS